MRDEAFTDDRGAVLDAVDLQALWVEVVGPRTNGGWPCPSPQHAQTGSTPPVNITKGLWFCHGCGAGGSAVDLLMFSSGVDVAEAFSQLRRRAGTPSRVAEASRSSRRPRSPQPAASAGDAGALAAFLESRGWVPETATRWGLSVVRDPRGRQRIRFPFHSAGQIIFHQDRALEDDSPKFLSESGSRPVPFAHDLAGALRNAHQLRCAVLLEGPSDLVALDHAFECPAALALPGVSTPPSRWAPALADLTVAVIADNDDAGEELRTTADEALAVVGASTHHVRVPDAHVDVDDWRRSHADDDAAFGAAVLAAFDAGGAR